MEMETGYWGETEKLYLASQGWGLQSSSGTETYPGWMKNNKKGLYNYNSSESQGKQELAAKWRGKRMKDTEQAQMLNAFLVLAFSGKVCHPRPCTQWQNLGNKVRQKLN